jgi:hypothetical protein
MGADRSAPAVHTESASLPRRRAAPKIARIADLYQLSQEFAGYTPNIDQNKSGKMALLPRFKRFFLSL